MERHQISAVLSYFILLLFIVVNCIKSDINIINLGYLVVVLCCMLKYFLIVNFDKR